MRRFALDLLILQLKQSHSIHEKKLHHFLASTTIVMAQDKITRSAILLTALVMALPTNAVERQDTLSLSEVVVTGSNLAVGRNLLPYTVSVVDREQIEASGQTQLLSDLSVAIPSLFVTQRGMLGFGVSNGGAGHIKMRGIGGDRASAVLMMVDGQPQFAGIYSHHVADFYTTDNVERVEVLRGPGSVLYGSNAMAGVINVITRNADEQGVHTTLSSEFGSYNTWVSSLTNAMRFGRFSSLVNVAYDRTSGNIDGMNFRQWSGYAKAGYEISYNWNTTADFTFMNSKSHDPVYPKLSDPESTDVYRQNVVRGEASLSASNTYESTSGNIRVYYSYGNHFIDDPRHFHSKDNRLGVLAYQNFKPWTGADMTAGFDYNTYSGAIPVSGGNSHHPGSLSTLSRKRITEYSPYVTLSQSLIGDDIIINGGVRLAMSDRFHNRWIPQAGITYRLPLGTTIKGSISSGYRNPSFRELYLYRMANPDLEPERLMNYEVSLQHRFSRYLTADLTAYFARGSNMIQTLDMKNVNTGRFHNKGIELSLSSHPINTLRLNATYSYLHTTLHNLTGAPRHQYYIGAIWNPIAPLTVGADLRGVARLFVSEGIDYQSYATLNINATYDVTRWLTLTLQADNITDARYMINRGYPMPGITAMGGFKLKF